jgi:hypothetical protein
MGDWAGKLPGNMSRFAGLIHCINAFEQGNDPLDTRINADEAHAAAEFARFFLAHGREVYAAQAEPPRQKHARYLWERIKSLNAPQVSKRELIRKTQGKQDFNLNDSLTALVERGYIRVEFVQSGNAGRPAETVIVNPETQNIVTLLTKSPAQDNKVNLVTIIPDVPNAKSAAEFAGFAELSADEMDDCPFTDTPTQATPQGKQLALGVSL